MKRLFKSLILVALALSFNHCKKEQGLKLLDVPQPVHFPKAVYNLTNNPVTEQGFAVGKKLFYDPLLSRDSSIACADCHISYSAFTHPDHATSHGIDNLFGKRNTNAIQNMLWTNQFFWDGGVPNLDLVPLNAIQSPVEMDNTPMEVVRRLNLNSEYKAMFAQAFPESDTINSSMMLQALSQFMVMLVSADSRYDRLVLGKGGADFTADELAGKQVFEQKCATCHSGALFTDQSFRNNGILTDFMHDGGRFEVSSLPADLGKFRVPSLRNIALTAPYMHDGKYATLESVVKHYAQDVQDNQALDPELKKNGVLGIPLSQSEQQQIVVFLRTLSDETFVRDRRFSQ
jgi:cytochrome c peroxidase